MLVDDHFGDDGRVVEEDALAVSLQLVHERLLNELELVADRTPEMPRTRYDWSVFE